MAVIGVVFGAVPLTDMMSRTFFASLADIGLGTIFTSKCTTFFSKSQQLNRFCIVVSNGFFMSNLAKKAITRVQAGLVIAVIVVAVIIGVAYPSLQPRPSQTSTTTGVSGGTIVVEEPAGPDSLDPAVAFSAQGGETVQQVYQGLLSFKPNSSEIVSLLAQSYTVSPDGLTYSFQLRQGITFSNGDPFNSYVLWYSIYRSAIMGQSPSYLVTVALDTTGVTSDMLNQFNTTTNVPPSNLLEAMQNPKLAVTVTGPYQLEFHLPTPFAAFLTTLTQPQAFAVDPNVVSAHGGVQDGKTNDWMTLNAVGTGPFLISQYQPNLMVIFQRNPNYWGGANGAQPAAHLSEVVVKVVANALTRLEDAQANSAQVVYLDFSLVSRALGQPGFYNPSMGPMPTVQFIAMDTQKFPFNNLLIRQAVVHAVNYTEVLQLFHGLGVSYVGPIPKGVPGYPQDLEIYSYNITLAKQLLAQAGYPNGQGLPQVTLVASTDTPPSPEVDQVVQANLAQIGIKVQIKSMTYSTMATFLTNPTNASYPDMPYDGWNWFPDPWAFANWFVGPLAFGPGNFAWYNNTSVMTLLKQADATTNPQQRAAIYQQIDRIVYNDAPYIWIAQVQNSFPTGVPIVNINVRGYAANLGFWESDFSTLYIGT